MSIAIISADIIMMEMRGLEILKDAFGNRITFKDRIFYLDGVICKENFVNVKAFGRYFTLMFREG